MLTDFIHSWSMFQDSYLAAILSGALLSVLGVWVVGRDEVFLAAAVAQASVLGVAMALTLGWTHPVIPAVLLSVAAAVAAGGRIHRGGTNREEITAWTFLLASSLAVLLLARAPVGMKNVQSLLTSTLLGATRHEVMVFAILAVVAAGFVGFHRQRLTLLVVDPVMASAVGLSVGLWSTAMSVALGVVTGLTIRSTGLLFTFGCLVLPALVAKNLCREFRSLFLVAPAVGVVGVLLGLLFAHGWDLPPGQLVVALLGLALGAAWGVRELRLHFAPG